MNDGDHAILPRGKIFYHVIIEEIDSKQAVSVRWFGYDRLFDVPMNDLVEFSIEYLLEHPVIYGRMSRKFVTRVLKSIEYQSGGRTLVYFKGGTMTASAFRKLSQEERDAMPLRGEIDYSALTPEEAVGLFFIKPNMLPYDRTKLGSGAFSYESIRGENLTTMVMPSDVVTKSRQTMGNGMAPDVDCNNKTCIILPHEVALTLMQRSARLNKLECYKIHPECNGAELLPTDLLRRLVFSEYMCKRRRVIKLPARNSILSIMDAFRMDPLDNTAIEQSKVLLRTMFEKKLLDAFSAMYQSGSLFYKGEEIMLYLCMDPHNLNRFAQDTSTSAFSIFGADHLLRVLVHFPDILREMGTDISYLLSRYLLLLDYLAEHQCLFAEETDYCSVSSAEATKMAVKG